MKFRKSFLFTAALLAVNYSTLFAASGARVWNPVPGRLWAQIVSVPPGSASAGRPDVAPGTDTTTGQTPSAPTNPSPAVPGIAGDTAQPSGAFPSTLPAGVPTVSTTAPTATTTTTSGTPIAGSPTGSTASTPARLPLTEQPVVVPKLPDNCTVTLEKTEVNIDATGGPVVFAPKFAPANCATDPVSTSSWLTRVKTANAAVYSFVASPNVTRFPRQAGIRVGNVSMRVIQAPGKTVPIAVAPSRFEFTVGGKGSFRQTLTTWSDQPGVAFAATASTPWLKVSPASNAGKAGAKKFNIEVAPAGLKPGRHQGAVEITSPGTVNAPIRIPIVVTVVEKPR